MCGQSSSPATFEPKMKVIGFTFWQFLVSSSFDLGFDLEIKAIFGLFSMCDYEFAPS